MAKPIWKKMWQFKFVEIVVLGFALALEKLNLSYQLVKGTVSSSLKAATGRRYYKAGHQSLMRQFIISIRDDLEPPVTGEDGRETIRVLEEIWKQIDLA